MCWALGLSGVVVSYVARRGDGFFPSTWVEGWDGAICVRLTLSEHRVGLDAVVTSTSCDRGRIAALRAAGKIVAYAAHQSWPLVQLITSYLYTCTNMVQN